MTDETTDREAAREAAEQWWEKHHRCGSLGPTNCCVDAQRAFLAGVDFGLALGRSGPAWTGASPVTPGWYWWRDEPLDDDPILEFWDRDEDGVMRTWEGRCGMSGEAMLVRFPACQWSDRPLTPPGDATRE